jgi:hypothetical protein
MNKREEFCNVIATRVAYPYIWNARGAFEFDCCGLVEWGMAQIGRPYPRNIASRELIDFHPVKVPRGQEKLGCLYLYSSKQTPAIISHVTIYFRQWKNGQKWLIGANGGGAKILTEATALAAGAMVKVVPDIYRISDLQYILDPFTKDDV